MINILTGLIFFCEGSGGRGNEAWFGLKHTGTAWKWITSSSPATFTDWARGEPQSNGCGFLSDAKEGRWASKNCNEGLPYTICELLFNKPD